MINFGNPEKYRALELEDDIEELKHTHEIELNRLTRNQEKVAQAHAHEMDRAKQTLDEKDTLHEDELGRRQKTHLNAMDQLIRDHDAELDELNARIEAYQDLDNSHQENIAVSAQLKEERAVLDAEKASFGNIKEAVKRARDEGQAIAEARYKSGYADGLSDGLRKGIDSTKGDRDELVKMAHKTVDNHKPFEIPAVAAPQIIVLGSQQKSEKK